MREDTPPLAVPTLLPSVAAWAAIHTKPRAEKVLAAHLQKQGIPHYLPVTRSRRAYGSRVRISWIPLFPGYLFYDHDTADRRVVYASRRVVRILVPDDFAETREDLENLAGLLERQPDLARCTIVEPGTPVEITSGPYQGIRGELIRRKGRTQLVLRVHFINYGAVIDIDESNVRALAGDET